MVLPAENRPMADRNRATLFGRIVLVALTLYALAMVAPDFLRVFRPGSVRSVWRPTATG